MYPRMHRMKVVRAPDLPVRALAAYTSVPVDVEAYRQGLVPLVRLLVSLDIRRSMRRR